MVCEAGLGFQGWFRVRKRVEMVLRFRGRKMVVIRVKSGKVVRIRD